MNMSFWRRGVTIGRGLAVVLAFAPPVLALAQGGRATSSPPMATRPMATPPTAEQTATLPTPPTAAEKADAALAADRVNSDRWYVLLLQGQRAGHMHSREALVNGQIVSTSDVVLKIKRERLTLSVGVQTEFVETPEGKPVRLSSRQKLGAMESKREITFNGDGTVTSVSTQATPGGPVTSTDTRPAPAGDWLAPAAAARKVKAELAAGATSMSLRVLDPSLGEQPVGVTRTVIERTTGEALGRVVPAVKWRTTVDALAGTEVIELVDDEGETIRSEVNLGGLSLVQVAADKDLALSELDAPELLASTLITPDRAIAGPRELKRAVYRITTKGKELANLPSVTGQTFERVDAQTAIVKVDARGGGAEAVGPDKLAELTKALTSVGPMVNHQDPKIVELAKGIDVAGLSTAEAAEKLRRFVHGYISAKDLSVGFASAAEVARTRAGDCTEHAVLLAALLRAKGVPSRVASGLVYADQFAGMSGVFGYHMWTQALVDGGGPGDSGAGPRWINVDATLPGGFAYDATHIIISTSGLGEGESQNFLVTTAPLIGGLKIEVIEP
jgi:transglutaminase-like putative cysteine protease